MGARIILLLINLLLFKFCYAQEDKTCDFFKYNLVSTLYEDYTKSIQIKNKVVFLEVNNCNDYSIYCFGVIGNLSEILGKLPSLYQKRNNNLFIIYFDNDKEIKRDQKWIKEFTVCVKPFIFDDTKTDSIAKGTYRVTLPVSVDIPYYSYFIKDNRIISTQIGYYCSPCNKNIPSSPEAPD